MNAEKIKVEIPTELQWREYRLHELIWLWRTAQLPPGTRFQNEVGEWRPLAELVEPRIKKENSGPAAISLTNDGNDSKGLWTTPLWATVTIVLLVLGGCGWRMLHQRHTQQGGSAPEERETLEWERMTRMEDFVKSREVVPGMTLEQVRRSIGEPKARKASADSSQQQWTYRNLTVIFSNGVVTRVELNPH